MKSEMLLTGMFEKHKLLYSFHMAIKLQQSQGTVTQEEVEFFVKGSVTSIKHEKGPPVPWITAQVS
jgi:dynein heavy chain